MKQRQFTTTVLNADDGMVLTQSADVHISERVFASEVSIGENSSPADWMEIDVAARQAYIAERAAYNRELEEQYRPKTDYAPVDERPHENTVSE